MRVPFRNLLTSPSPPPSHICSLHEAEQCFREAIAVDPYFSDAHWNLGQLMRQMGKQSEAVELCWESISASYASENEGSPPPNAGKLFAAVDINLLAQGLDKINISHTDEGKLPIPPKAAGRGITVACVKWGTKYGSEYVNRLASVCGSIWKRRTHLYASQMMLPELTLV